MKIIKLIILFVIYALPFMAFFSFSSCSSGTSVSSNITDQDDLKILTFSNAGNSEKDGNIIYDMKNGTILVKRDSAYKLEGITYHTMSIRFFTFDISNSDSVNNIYNQLNHH